MIVYRDWLTNSRTLFTVDRIEYSDIGSNGLFVFEGEKYRLLGDRVCRRWWGDNAEQQASILQKITGEKHCVYFKTALTTFSRCRLNGLSISQSILHVKIHLAINPYYHGALRRGDKFQGVVVAVRYRDIKQIKSQLVKMGFMVRGNKVWSKCYSVDFTIQEGN